MYMRLKHIYGFTLRRNYLTPISSNYEKKKFINIIIIYIMYTFVFYT